MKLELRSLRAINCGPLRDVCIDFCDPSGKPQPITVLAGANGSGKTTVLELIVALAEVLDPANSATPQYAPNEPRYIPRVLKSITSHKGYVQMDLLADSKSVNIFYGTPPPDPGLQNNSFVVNKMWGSVQNIEGNIVPAIRGGIFSQTNKEIAFPPPGQPTSTQENLPIPSILYFPCSRYFLPIEGEQIGREKTKYQWVYRYETARSFEGSLDSYLIWLDYAEPETFARVIEFLNSLDFDGKTFSVRRKELKVIVTTRDGQTHYLEDLSSGEQNILIMLLELRRRLLPHSIVLIDEIENSLHPAFQYRLANALKRMQAQIPFQLIVTTHAQAFVDIFGTESIRILTEF